MQEAQHEIIRVAMPFYTALESRWKAIRAVTAIWISSVWNWWDCTQADAVPPPCDVRAKYHDDQGAADAVGVRSAGRGSRTAQVLKALCRSQSPRGRCLWTEKQV